MPQVRVRSLHANLGEGRVRFRALWEGGFSVTLPGSDQAILVSW